MLGKCPFSSFSASHFKCFLLSRSPSYDPAGPSSPFNARVPVYLNLSSNTAAGMASSDEKLSKEEHLGSHTNGSASQKDIESVPAIDYHAENKLIRKLDLMIVPPVMLLYLFSFLDRVGQVQPMHIFQSNTVRGQYWKREIVWDGRRFESRQRQIPNSW